MTFDFRQIIEARRDGLHHPDEDLERLASGAADGTIPDYQLASWLMAAYLNPLSLEETVGLTKAMACTGAQLDLSSIPRPWVDKHSTGGVGDKTTIVLLPLLGACGVSVVKMSGPGLGITGGTVDKLLSIPGFRVDMNTAELVAQASKIRIAFGGQTSELAPADKVLYGLRDATSTVDSNQLITTSILSKKLAGGAETIVLDVKCGRGAFVGSLVGARELAGWLEAVGGQCGMTVRTIITDMDQPLGSAVGNALEVMEALEVLTRPESELPGPTRRFRELCLQLAGETLCAAGVSNTAAEGRALAEERLTNGSASDKAQEWILAQGGPDSIAGTLNSLEIAPEAFVLRADRGGWIGEIDARAIGQACNELGGGRLKKGDPVDLGVGLKLRVSVGDQVQAGDELATVYGRPGGEVTGQGLGSAIAISEAPVSARPLILESE